MLHSLQLQQQANEIDERELGLLEVETANISEHSWLKKVNISFNKKKNILRLLSCLYFKKT